MPTLLLPFVAAQLVAAVAAASVLENPTVDMVLAGGWQVHLEVVGATAFRLGVRTGAADGSAPLPNLFVSPSVLPPAAATLVHGADSAGSVGLKTVFGSLSIDPAGSLCFRDDAGALISQRPLLRPARRMPGAAAAAATVSLALAAAPDALVFGFGGDKTEPGRNGNPFVSTGVTPLVGNTKWFVPSYWHDAGYSALAVASRDYDPARYNQYPVSWKLEGESESLEWTFAAGSADLYLLPAATIAAGASALAGLTGPPAVPPLYAFGFLACRWGWNNRSYIESTLERFRSDAFPLDAFISDYGWFTDTPNAPTQDDFGYNPETFPEPKAQLADYHTRLGVRFGAIRKPRIANATMLAAVNKSGYLLPTANSHDPSRPGPASNNLNFSVAAARTWYADHQAHYLSDGVDFWWNDEGETAYEAYHLWNIAHREALEAHDATRRLFTLNRAYTPGLGRIGVAIWTGDIDVSWQSFQNTPATMLRWGLAGAVFTACDTGGFEGGNSTPELLSRWYQFSALAPIMRVHSRIQNAPHWPWLYGDAAEAAMRAALALRYRLVPLIYSLAHEAHRTSAPLMRPLLWDYADVSHVSDQWTLGGSLLAAPVMESGATERVVVLPALAAGTGAAAAAAAAGWYRFNTTATSAAGTNVTVPVPDLSTIPIFVRAGSLLPLAPPGVQSTAELTTSGPLEVQIYPGADAGFTFVEDDGVSYGYRDAGLVRVTEFTWSDAGRTLTWNCTGSFKGPAFASLRATLFDPAVAEPVISHIFPVGSGGQLSF